MPTKVHEALACGRPVVTADTAAARELLQDGVDALLVPPAIPAALAAAVERLGDERLRASLGDGRLSRSTAGRSPRRPSPAVCWRRSRSGA